VERFAGMAHCPPLLAMAEKAIRTAGEAIPGNGWAVPFPPGCPRKGASGCDHPRAAARRNVADDPAVFGRGASICFTSISLVVALVRRAPRKPNACLGASSISAAAEAGKPVSPKGRRSGGRSVRPLPYPFTIQNATYLIFAAGLGDLYVRWRVARYETRLLGLALLPEDDSSVLQLGDLGPIRSRVVALYDAENGFLPYLIDISITQLHPLPLRVPSPSGGARPSGGIQYAAAACRRRIPAAAGTPSRSCRRANLPGRETAAPARRGRARTSGDLHRAIGIAPSLRRLRIGAVAMACSGSSGERRGSAGGRIPASKAVSGTSGES